MLSYTCNTYSRKGAISCITKSISSGNRTKSQCSKRNFSDRCHIIVGSSFFVLYVLRFRIVYKFGLILWGLYGDILYLAYPKCGVITPKVCRGVSARRCLSRGCLSRGCLPRGVSARGVSDLGGVCSGGCHNLHEQNHRGLWKHNLAATTLQTVLILHTVFPLLLIFKVGCETKLKDNRSVGDGPGFVRYLHSQSTCHTYTRSILGSSPTNACAQVC